MNRGKSLSRDLCPTSWILAASFSFKDDVSMHPDVVDPAGTKTLTEEGKFCLRALADLYALMHARMTSAFAKSWSAV